ncbi:MAG: hypothetical protein Q8K02_15955 [Flavobacterium sp.]|nr:hypothetical protein [Flavobacterium sp.]
MEISFTQIIENRKSELSKRQLLLEEAKKYLKIIGPINFSMADVIEVGKYNPRKKGLKIGIPQLGFLEESKDAYIYFFELVDVLNKSSLLENIKEFKSVENINLKRALPKCPNSLDDNDSNILYVGSIKENIHKRIKEHIGFGSSSTYALNLRFWVPKELKLNFYYIKIDNPILTYDIEAALTDYLNPLIGKKEK